MRCTSPRTVGYQADGCTLAWSQKKWNREYATFKLPCGKCIECRLEYARQWAIRCIHEASMHEQNSFVTATYDEEHLPLGGRLDYRDWQLFIKRLRRSLPSDQIISIFVTGEYGDQKKRPHWHALIFNYEPKDKQYKYSNHRGDKVYDSQELSAIWGKGIIEVGSVTMESAGYCARYAAKKLVHGRDGEHDYNPISKKSSKRAIGRSWIEVFWRDVFSYGHVVLPDGSQSSIPRYYEKWLKENLPLEWERYVTERKQKNIDRAQVRAEKEEKTYIENAEKRRGLKGPGITKNEIRRKITLQKLKELNKKQKF